MTPPLYPIEQPELSLGQQDMFRTCCPRLLQNQSCYEQSCEIGATPRGVFSRAQYEGNTFRLFRARRSTRVAQVLHSRLSAPSTSDARATRRQIHENRTCGMTSLHSSAHVLGQVPRSCLLSPFLA